MAQRVDYMKVSADLTKKLFDLSMEEKKSVIEENIRDLIHIRASQLNGCAFCLDMHVKEAKIHGESELRLYHLPVWRESNLFSARERAALEWTEVLTSIPANGVSDEIYNHVREQFSEKEISDLTYSVASINAWNRLNIAFTSVPGSSDTAFGLTKAGLS
ncbi:Carboxymuconolactone decarboxylase family protein [compost metagenome]